MAIKKERFELQFTYYDSRNITDKWHVTVLSEDKLYLKTVTTKNRQFRTFRKDRILEILHAPENWRLTFDATGAPPVKIRSANPQKRPDINDYPMGEICFTGFKAADKKQYEDKATFQYVIITYYKSYFKNTMKSYIEN